MSDRDSWGTPQALFDELRKEFVFAIDACADENNAKCDLYYSKDNSCLDVEYWQGWRDYPYCVFMNPPYSNPRPFIEKAWEQSQYMVVVCLVKVDPSTRWWATFWDYDMHRPKPGCEVRFLPKRVKFVPPSGVNGKHGPTFPSAVVVMDRRNEK